MGNDRVIDLYFTTGTDNYHIIVELYDRVSQYVITIELGVYRFVCM